MNAAPICPSSSSIGVAVRFPAARVRLNRRQPSARSSRRLSIAILLGFACDKFLSIDRSAMSNYIPEDCWPEILKLLPVKSLARFRCVCRQWNALICSSSFVADHLASSKSKPRLFITSVYHKSSEEKSCVIFDSGSSPAATYIPHIMPTDLRSYRLVGSAKGIICFYVGEVYSVNPRERCDIVLWNPVINKYIKLPDETRTHSRVSLAVAIGVKPSEQDDLRILRVSSNRSDHWTNATAAVAEIYSVRQGEWRVLHTNTRCRNFHYDSGLKSYVNGGVHWIASKNNAGSYHLIRFGFEEEEFSCITLPDVLADSHPCDLHVAVYRGRLALLQQHYRENSIWKIWTKDGNEDSWSVIICIDSMDVGHNFIQYGIRRHFIQYGIRHHFIQYGITHDGQILTLSKDDDVLVLYNPTSTSFRRLNMQAAEYRLNACPFVESLVFMDGEGGALNLPPLP